MTTPLVNNGAIVLEGTIMPQEYIWPGETGVFSPEMVRTALAEFEGDVTVMVNSPGGYPGAGEAIRVMLDQHPGEVTVHIAGDAASAASLMVMGADRIEMSMGSVMMIHDPSTITFGTAEDHQATVEMLNVLAGAYADVYAARTGMTADEARQLMQDETWMTAADAVARGFADAVMGAADGSTPNTGDEPSAAVMAALQITAQTRHAAALRMIAEKRQFNPPREGHQPATVGGPVKATQAAKEVKMTTKTKAAKNGGQPVNTATPESAPGQAPTPTPVPDPVQMDAAAIRAQERTRSRTIMSSARPHVESGAISQEFVDVLIDDGVGVEMASHRILEQLAAAQPDLSMANPAGRVRVGREDVETRREGLTLALSARLAGEEPTDDRARPYAVMSIHEMAAASMGQPAPGFGSYDRRDQIIMNAMHTTSDFPNILSTSVNRVLARQYELVERTFTAISREMTFNDFRAHDVVRPDEFPTLTKVNETGEIKFGTLGDSKETVALVAYAVGISISRQALVNDDMGAIQDVIDNAAAIVPEFEEDTFWTAFLANGALADGVAMFHASHGNLAGTATAITVAAIAAGRQAMRQMKAADGKRVIRMNEPSILLVGPAKQTEAEQFVNQIIQPTKSVDTNPFTGRLTVVVTESITDNAWYLVVDPSKRTHNYKHGYLRDRAAPRVRVDDPFGVQGVRMTLEQDFGVGGVNYRGAYKNSGA